jgi:hypothetical protein
MATSVEMNVYMLGSLQAMSAAIEHFSARCGAVQNAPGIPTNSKKETCEKLIASLVPSIPTRASSEPGKTLLRK